MSSPSINIVLIGSGGVGTVAALALSKCGRAKVTTVLRSTYKIVKEKGWDIDSVDYGEVRDWKPHRVVGSVEDAVYSESDSNARNIKKEVYDYVVVCTKQLPNISPTHVLIAPLITPNHTTIVLIQNGILIEEPLIIAFPETPILSAVSMIGSFTIPPNRISHIGNDVLQIGAHYHAGCPESISTAKLHEFVTLYRDGGSAGCTIAPDITKARWSKLLWNASFNSLCALLVMDVGQIQRCERSRGLVLRIMKEIVAVAGKSGCLIEDETVMHMANRSPDDSKWRPSMLQDRDAGRPMEIEAILGNAVRRGLQLGVLCPTMESIYELLKVVDWATQEQ